MKIPTSTPQGTLRILVSDGDTLDKMHRVSGPMSRHLDLGSTIALLNKEHTNSESTSRCWRRIRKRWWRTR